MEEKGPEAAAGPGEEGSVRFKTKKRIARALVVVIIAATIIGAVLITNVYADTVGIQGNGWDERHEAAKNPRTGLYKRGGHWYYGHMTKSALYKVGDLTRDSFRIIDGKYYYFCHNGRMLTRNTHYMTVRKGRNGLYDVKYVYYPGTGKKSRFNVDLRRGQDKKNGRWITETGMRYDLYGQIDMQP